MDTVFARTEYVSLAKVNNLIKSTNIPDADKVKLKKYKRLWNRKGFRVQYEHADGSYNRGRIYPIGMIGLQGMRRPIRNYLASDNYVMIDITCAQPTILNNIMKEYNISNKLLNNYVKDPAKFIKKLGVDKAYIKKQFFHIMYDQNFKTDQPILESLHDDIYKRLAPILSHDIKYSKLYQDIEKCRKRKINIWKTPDEDGFCKPENKLGRFVSLILQEAEFELLQKAVKFMREKDIAVDVYIHDAIMLQKSDKVNTELVDELNKFMKSVSFKFESMTDEVIDINSENDIDDSPLSKTEEVIEFILENMNNCYRHDGTYIFKIDDDIPILFNRISKFSEWLDSLFQKEDKYLRYYMALNKDSLCNTLLCRDHPRFKRMKNTTNILVFKNGFLDYRDPFHVKFKCFTEADNITTVSVINREYNPKASTQLFDKYISHQLDDDIAKYYRGMVIARSFYKLGEYDKYEFFPYIFGEPQTGKTAGCEIHKRLNPSIGYFNKGSHSANFCLEPLYDHDIGILDDMPEHLDTIIDATNLQKMSSAQMITINIKNQKPITMKWIIPIIILSNFFLKIKGHDKAVARRLMCFFFANTVINGDTMLIDKIFDNEIEAVIQKCCSDYVDLINLHKNKAFYNWNIEYFKNFQDKYIKEDDVLDEFIKSEHIAFMKTSYISLTDFKKHFLKYQKDMNRNYIKQNITSSDLMDKFKHYDVEVKTIKICKMCRCKFNSNIKCCRDHSIANRVNVVVIYGIYYQVQNNTIRDVIRDVELIYPYQNDLNDDSD